MRRWCIVHATHMTADGDARASPRAARSPDSRRRPKPIWVTARFRRVPISMPGGAFGVGSDSNTIVDPYAGAAPARMVAAARALVAQRARGPRGAPVGPVALCCARPAAAAQALARRRRRRSLRDARRISSCSTPTIPRSRTHARDAIARCRDLRPVPATGARRDGRRTLDRARRPSSARGRGARRYRKDDGGTPERIAMMTRRTRVRRVVVGAHLATMAGDQTTRTAAIRDGAIGIAAAIASPGSARCAICRATRRVQRLLDVGRRWVDARPHRLPHASRLRGQSRERVRSAPDAARSHAEIARAGRRHQRDDRVRDARGIDDELVGAEPAASSRRSRPKA